MSGWIKTAKVGDKIVCTGRILQTVYGENTPKQGAVYTIREIRAFDADIGVCLDEVVNKAFKYYDGQYEPAFDAGAFRPIQNHQTDISIFTRLLNTTPADLVEA